MTMSMIDIITSAGEFAGGLDSAAAAAEWDAEDFAPSEAAEWLGARCFDAGSAATLRDLGVTPEQASTRTSAGIGGYTDTIGYKVSNGDLSATKVRAILTPDPEVECECGEAMGEKCAWSGPRSETVVVEYMPEQHRASHTAAGNSGVYPHNGAVRIRCERSCADRIVEADGPEWAGIVD